MQPGFQKLPEAAVSKVNCELDKTLMFFNCDTTFDRTFTDVIMFEKDEWMSILRLATRWRFLNLRKIVIRRLEAFEFSALESIILGREMKLSKRLIEGYTEVVVSSDTISDEDAAVIGWQTTVKLLRLREKISINRNSLSWDGVVSLLSEKIRGALYNELLGILAEEMVYNTDSDYQSESEDEHYGVKKG